MLFKLLPVLITICQVDYLHGSWWPKMEDLREMGIPCYRFLIYRCTRWPRVKSFNFNLFLKLVLYLSHVSKLQVHAASRRVGLGQHWLRSLGSGWTSAIMIFTVTMNTLVIVVGFKDVIVNAAYIKSCSGKRLVQQRSLEHGTLDQAAIHGSCGEVGNLSSPISINLKQS